MLQLWNRTAVSLFANDAVLPALISCAAEINYGLSEDFGSVSENLIFVVADVVSS